MSQAQNPNAQSSKILLVAGCLSTLFGLFMYSQRLLFAALFFKAQFLFGLPLSGTDALKVTVITVCSVVTTLMGLTILGVGLALLVKPSAPQSGASQGSTATPTHR